MSSSDARSCLLLVMLMLSVSSVLPAVIPVPPGVDDDVTHDDVIADTPNVVATIIVSQDVEETGQEESPCTLAPTSLFHCTTSQQQIFCFLTPPHTDLTPGKASNLTVSTYEDGSKTGLEIQWGLPKGATVNHLEGFVIEVYYMSGAVGALSCTTMQITNGQWPQFADQGSNTSPNVTFIHKQPDILLGREYQVIVRSLPLAADLSNVVTQSLTVPQRPQQLAAANWRSSLSLLTKEGGLVEFEFSLAPAQFGFTTYYLQLFLCRDSISEHVGTNTCVNQRRVQLFSYDVSTDPGTSSNHTFHDVQAGIYQIKLRPSSRSTVGQCVCPYWDSCSCMGSRSPCFTIQTQPTIEQTE